MTKLFPILIICSIGFTQEMEVDGNLKVTGTVESATIDSLKAVIADLQAQLAALQAQGGLTTRLYDLPTITWTPIANTEFLLDIVAITGYELENVARYHNSSILPL